MPKQTPNPLTPHLPPHAPKLLLTPQITELLLPSSLHNPLVEPFAFLQRIPTGEPISSSPRMLRVLRQNLSIPDPVHRDRQVNCRERVRRASVVGRGHNVSFELLWARRRYVVLEVAQGGKFGGQGWEVQVLGFEQGGGELAV